MKIFHFFGVDLKNLIILSRKIKLMICNSILVISFTVIGYRTISLASVNKDNITNINNKKIESKAFNSVRGNIYDRNNKILATTIDTLSLNINPQEVLNKHETIIKLSKIFPELDKKDLLKNLTAIKNMSTYLEKSLQWNMFVCCR